MYLASMGNPSERDTWLIDSGASCHMTPHREWFCEYEKYNGGYVYVGDDSPSCIIGRGRVKLKLKDGRIRTLLGVLHIPNLARNLIFVRNMDVADVNTVCGDGGCKMVLGSMVLMRGFRYGTLYKILGSTIIDECNRSIVPKERGKNDMTLTSSRGKTMLWHQILGYIRDNGL